MASDHAISGSTDTGTLPVPPEIPKQWQSVALWGLGLIFVTFVLFGGWAAVARLDGAAVAPGVVTTEGNIRTVQHLEGGIVKELRVENGMQVEAGDLLLELDTTQSEATVRLYRRQLAAARATEARLNAEQNLSESLTFPEAVTSMADDPFVAQAISVESAQFEANRSSLNQQIDILRVQNRQINNEISVLKAEQEAATAELDIVSRRLADLRQLSDQKLVRRADVLEIERDNLNLKSKVARTHSEISRAEQRIAENKLKVAQLRQDYLRQAADELPALNKEIRELERQIVVSGDQLKRAEVRAPVSGIVQELAVFTEGGVVGPGEPILNISPVSENIVVEARVRPSDADMVAVGDAAEVRFPAFSTLNLEPISGVVISRSGDRIEEEGSDEEYFLVRIRVDTSSLPKNLAARIGPGLPSDVIIPTESRTALTYLLDPVLSKFETSMRER